MTSRDELLRAAGHRLESAHYYRIEESELTVYLDEALRVWNALTGYRRVTATVAANGGYYLANPCIPRTVTDTELLNGSQYYLLETPGMGTAQSGNWTSPEFADSLAHRTRAFQAETLTGLARETLAVSVGQTAFALSGSHPKIARVAFLFGANGRPLVRTDRWNLRVGLAGSSPLVYIDDELSGGDLEISPASSVVGNLEVWATSRGDISAGGLIMPLPDDLTPFVRWGVTAELVRKADPRRAEYAERRFREGFAVAQIYKEHGWACFYGGNELQRSSFFGLDHTEPGWQVAAQGAPTRFWSIGQLWVGVHPRPATGNLEVRAVGNAPVDAVDTGVGEWNVSTILDYVQHVAFFKMGGPLFESTFPLYQNFLQAAQREARHLNMNLPYKRYLGVTLDDYFGVKRSSPAL